MNDYAAFLAAKAALDPPSGLSVVPSLPWVLRPFQRAVTEWALRRGRAAMFEGTGLGKTLQQLSWARTVADHEGAAVLLLTPLAVAEQTVAEAAKFGIPGVAYAADRSRVRSDIVVTNYERFDKFDIGQFCGVVLDESGIIKSQDGKTRIELTDACRDTPWRLCCSATPAPNDYTELGQHAEFLGVMTAKEMLSMFFVHDGGIRAEASAGVDGWRLKRHAEADFWRWLASWAVAIRHPADLGFDEPDYDLPALRYHQITVPTDAQPVAGMLFPTEARTLSERIAARRVSLDRRVAAAVNIVRENAGDPWLIWCGLNAEADAIERALAPLGALQVAGADQVAQKVDRLLGFKDGRPPILISKPSIAGHGMNWQHCRRMIFVGLNDSFEQLFQAVRRCWRFGQTGPVDVYLIASELEGAVVANLRRKEADYEAMLGAMAAHMRDLMRENVRGGRLAVSSYTPTKRMELPAWMA